MLHRIAAAALFSAAAAAALWPSQAPSTPAAEIQRQPTWPYRWSSEVERLARSGDFSSRFDAALSKTAQLGPAERKLRLRMAALGLHFWESLSPTARALTHANIDATLAVQPGPLLISAFTMRRESLVCDRWDGGGDIETVCSRWHELRKLCDRPAPSVDLVVWCLERNAVPRHPPRARYR
ncbi:hypothetical protein [Sinimarinibacterium flocculans]|uniref:hypothetical protein n=1 Tax=Sinimarinibacterium flocculans TaxID=985250 RepID=UPI00248FB894|nr:hypothetical protein [Sinimarinibacterium flocculans]